MRPLLGAATAVALLALAPPAHAGTPSAGRCAGAWNTGAPPQARRVVVDHRVRQATSTVARVFTGRDVYTRSGSTTGPTSDGPGCALTFFVSPKQVLSVLGTWRNGHVVAWSAHVVPARGASGSGNACVADDGSIHRVGHFTAATRCG